MYGTQTPEFKSSVFVQSSYDISRFVRHGLWWRIPCCPVDELLSISKRAVYSIATRDPVIQENNGIKVTCNFC